MTVETPFYRYANQILTAFYDGPESQLEFCGRTDSGDDLQLSEAEETSLIQIVDAYTCGWDLPLDKPGALWWYRFITYILRNVTIGSDEFKKSRAGLITPDLMGHIREQARLSLADFREMSLAEVFNEIERIVRHQKAAKSTPDKKTGGKDPVSEVGPFVPQWLRLIFGVEDNRTLKERLKYRQREESERKWYVPASCLDAVGDWKELLRAASKTMPASAQTKVNSLISLY